MAKLGSFVSSILAEVAEARLAADLETIRIAELYSSHPLLKHMPVPRFRLPEINLDFPVLISEENDTHEPIELNSALGATNPPTESERGELITKALAFADISLPGAKKKILIQKIKNEVDRTWNAPSPLLSANRISDEIKRNLTKELDSVSSEVIEPTKKKRFEEALKVGTQGLLISKVKKQIYTIPVKVNTQELQNLSNPDLAMNVRLSISEESYELTFGEDENGNTIQYFTQE